MLPSAPPLSQAPPVAPLRPAAPGGGKPVARARSSRGRGVVRRSLPWLIGAGLLALLVYGLLPKPLPIEAGTVTRGPLSVAVLEEGKTRIRHRYTISPPVSGFLHRVPLRAGDRIQAGKTVLGELEAEAASLLNPRSQSETEARVRAAEATFHQRQADLERAHAADDLAQRELNRAIPLRKSGAISTKEWDAAEMQASMRGREQRSAEFAEQVAKFELQQAEAALLQARGGVAAAGEPLTIPAPIDGFVLNVFEESARVLPAGTPVMEVGDPADLEAEIELLSTDAAGVARGAPVLIERWGGPRPLRATVSMVEPAAFTKISALGVEEQRVKVRVQFEDAPPPELQLGDRYRVEARITTWSAAQVAQVPAGALFRRGGDWMCYRLEGNQARLRKVEIGHNDGQQAEVLGGLEVGDRVILHAPDAVVEGGRVVERKP